MKSMSYMARILTVVFLAGSLGTATPAPAATIIRNGDRLVLTGPIQPGDDTAFAAAVDDGVKMVVLGSDGGRVYEAMAIGRLIRKRHLNTAVPSSCASACALVWAAGQRRAVDGRLGMHCPTFLGELQCYAPVRRAMIAYLREMGAPTAVIELQEAAGSTSPLWVPEAALRIERAQLLAAQPAADAEGGAEPHANDLPEEEQPEPPPPRRRPMSVYGPPPPPPGWIVIPGEQRAMPCLPTLLTLGLLRFCI
jgi:hypothetical protein